MISALAALNFLVCHFYGVRMKVFDYPFISAADSYASLQAEKHGLSLRPHIMTPRLLIQPQPSSPSSLSMLPHRWMADQCRRDAGV
jgi:hypothetical protein